MYLFTYMPKEISRSSAHLAVPALLVLKSEAPCIRPALCRTRGVNSVDHESHVCCRPFCCATASARRFSGPPSDCSALHCAPYCASEAVECTVSTRPMAHLAASRPDSGARGAASTQCHSAIWSSKASNAPPHAWSTTHPGRVRGSGSTEHHTTSLPLSRPLQSSCSTPPSFPFGACSSCSTHPLHSGQVSYRTVPYRVGPPLYRTRRRPSTALVRLPPSADRQGSRRPDQPTPVRPAAGSRASLAHGFMWRPSKFPVCSPLPSECFCTVHTSPLSTYVVHTRRRGTCPVSG